MEEEPLGVQAEDFGSSLPGLAQTCYIQGHRKEPGVAWSKGLGGDVVRLSLWLLKLVPREMGHFLRALSRAVTQTVLFWNSLSFVGGPGCFGSQRACYTGLPTPLCLTCQPPLSHGNALKLLTSSLYPDLRALREESHTSTPSLLNTKSPWSNESLLDRSSTQ